MLESWRRALIFAKFSRSTGRVAFSKYVTIGPMNGVPTVMIRVGNERRNTILEASIRVVMLRTEHQLEEGIDLLPAWWTSSA